MFLSVGNENEDPNNNNTTDSEEDEPDTDPVEIDTKKKKGKRKHSLENIDTSDEPLTKLKKKDSVEKSEKSERSSGDNKTLKKIKDVFKGKYKKGKKSEIGIVKNEGKDSVKTEAAVSKSNASQTSGKVAKKAKTNIDDELADASNVVMVTAGIPALYRVTRESVKKDNAKAGTSAQIENAIKDTKKDLKKKKQVDTDKGAEQTNVKNTIATPTSEEKVTPAKKRKAPSPPIIVTDQNGEETPKNEQSGNNSKPTGTDLEEGEIELWVPNKKYKKTPQSGVINTPKAALFTFDGSKPPPAFVKRSLVKADRTPKTPVNPGSAKARSDKRVSFNMKKNKAQGKHLPLIFL